MLCSIGYLVSLLFYNYLIIILRKCKAFLSIVYFILEQSVTNELECRTKLFYCDPNNPNQKPMIERNHEFLRRILHKGNSIDFLRQQDLNLIMNHINSYNRFSNNWYTPNTLFTSWLDKKEIKSLNICEIPSDEIVLKPYLLADRKKQYHAELRKNKSPN